MNKDISKSLWNFCKRFNKSEYLAEAKLIYENDAMYFLVQIEKFRGDNVNAVVVFKFLPKDIPVEKSDWEKMYRSCMKAFEKYEKSILRIRRL